LGLVKERPNYILFITIWTFGISNHYYQDVAVVASVREKKFYKFFIFYEYFVFWVFIQFRKTLRAGCSLNRWRKFYLSRQFRYEIKNLCIRRLSTRVVSWENSFLHCFLIQRVLNLQPYCPWWSLLGLWYKKNNSKMKCFSLQTSWIIAIIFRSKNQKFAKKISVNSSVCIAH
jgi:hypothetical protein